MLNYPQAAKMALLAAYAEDMFEALGDDHTDVLAPPVDSRVASEWNILGYLSGRDAVLDAQRFGMGDVVYYGFLASSKADPSQYVAVVRGTERIIEWLVDAEFLPVPHALAGNVPNGFYSIYGSMSFTGPDGTLQGVSAADGIAQHVQGNSLTVVGHSLGSALATYLTLDLVVGKGLKDKVSACVFASPRPGDSAFCAYFDRQLASYSVFNYCLDLVPQVPKFFGYQQLSRAVEIDLQSAEAKINFDLKCNHHAVCYAAMLDYGAADWSHMPACDQGCAKCIRGANQAK